MDIFVWIVVIFFASLGIAQVLEWIMGIFRQYKPQDGYHVTLLQDDAETLEAQVRHALAQARWNGAQPLFVDTGLTGEALELCEILLADAGGVPICKLEELPETIHLLEKPPAKDG